ncbi:MAG TPA: hypothetical protein VFI45_20505 [Candidatus Acidoferrum sp.]|nr:hypothetical protein [Candidatus Acidoferrum sp.]
MNLMPAPSVFRRKQSNQHFRLAANVIAILALLTNWFVISVSPAMSQTKKPRGERPPRITKIYPELAGDPKVVHRFLSYLEFALEDRGIQIVNLPKQADAVLFANFTLTTEKGNLSAGLRTTELIVNGGREIKDECSTVSDSETTELFTNDAENLSANLRAKFPDAKTVWVDPASKNEISSHFWDDLPRQLTSHGFRIDESGQPDLKIHVILQRIKVPIEKRMLNYELELQNLDGKLLFSQSSGGPLSARLLDDPPPACSSTVIDLDWLTQQDPLFQSARGLAKRLHDQNVEADLYLPMDSIPSKH